MCVSRKKSKVCVCLLGSSDWLQIPQLRASDPSGFVLSLMTEDSSKGLTCSYVHSPVWTLKYYEPVMWQNMVSCVSVE